MGKEPWFRNHDYNGKEIRRWFAGQVAISKSRFLSAARGGGLCWWFAGQVAISKSRFLSVAIPFRKDRAR